MKLYSFTSGPLIKVSIEGKGDFLSRAVLASHHTFCCEVSDDLSEEATSNLYTWLEAYSKGLQPTAHIAIDIRHLAPFTRKVLEEMLSIPFGSVESYSSLAIRASSPRAARAVGNICRANLFPLFIPCHRVLREGGALGGFAYGLAMKEALLRFEKTT